MKIQQRDRLDARGSCNESAVPPSQTPLQVCRAPWAAAEHVSETMREP